LFYLELPRDIVFRAFGGSGPKPFYSDVGVSTVFSTVQRQPNEAGKMQENGAKASDSSMLSGSYYGNTSEDGQIARGPRSNRTGSMSIAVRSAKTP
jgi:hypothetical protein